MKSKRLLFTVFLATVLFAGSIPAHPPAQEDTMSHSMKDKDPASILLEVDRAFSARAREVGMPTAFVEYAAEDAVMYRNNMEPVIGRKAIARLLGPEAAVTLIWKPLVADIAESGDLGYTRGSFTYKAPPDNTAAPGTGHYEGYYVTIWKKQADGSWKWVFDSGVVSRMVPAQTD